MKHTNQVTLAHQSNVFAHCAGCSGSTCPTTPSTPSTPAPSSTPTNCRCSADAVFLCNDVAAIQSRFHAIALVGLEQVLRLDENELTELHRDTWNRASKLRLLNVSHNELRALPEDLLRQTVRRPFIPIPPLDVIFHYSKANNHLCKKGSSCKKLNLT